MGLKLIILGELNKKHLLPVFLALSQVCIQLMNIYYPESKRNLVLEIYTTSLAIISVRLIPYIFKFWDNVGLEKGNSKKNKCLHYFLLILFYNLDNIATFLPQNMKTFQSKKISHFENIANPLVGGPFINNCIDMIFLAIASKLLLKYNYYIHHVISISIFIFLCLACDIFLNNFSKMKENGPLTNIFNIISILADVVIYNYEKYMMEKLLYPYWKISIPIGISLFIVSSCLTLLALIDKDKEKSVFPYISEFYTYFKTVNPFLIIGRIVLAYVIYFIYNTLSFLNIYYFDPNFIMISFQLSKIIQVLINAEPEQYYCIIFFILQLFILMIYLEILELNFCNLNKNTKRNIQLRGLDELWGNVEGDSSTNGGEIELNGEYLLNSNESIYKSKSNIISRVESLMSDIN